MTSKISLLAIQESSKNDLLKLALSLSLDPHDPDGEELAFKLKLGG